MHPKLGWWIVVGLAGAVGVAVGWQRRAADALRAELAREKITTRSPAQARTEHDRLLLAQPTAGELERLTAEAAALAKARAEVAALRERVDRTANSVVEKTSDSEERLAVGRTCAAEDWRNSGTATPQAALETALWAGAGGDVETFAKTVLMINRRAKQAAQVLWDSLPEATRTHYDSPEKLIAFLSMRDVPLGSVLVRQFAPINGWPSPAAQMQVMLRGADGQARDATLLFMNPGDGWKLVVTEGVVAKYAAMLKDTKAAGAGR